MIAAAPALPLHTAGPYVAAAYIVFVAVVVIYLAIMAIRLRRTERELASLRAELEARESSRDPSPRRDLETVGAGRPTRAPAVASPDGERGPA